MAVAAAGHTPRAILEVALEGDGSARAVAKTSVTQTHAELSPDGRWLAFTSDDSGQPELYVQAYPGPGGRWQVSRNGGSEPRWRGDGRELFYFGADNTLMAAEIVADREMLAVGRVESLFKARDKFTLRYAVSRDGARFLVNVPVEERGASPITFVTDWTAVP